MGEIYLVTNIINEKKYIGQTRVGFQKRWSEHVSHANNEKSDFSVLHRAMKKYGIPSFRVEKIFECPEEELNFHEQRLIEEYDSLHPRGYNLVTGGKGKAVSELTREKLSTAGKNRFSDPEESRKHGERMRDYVERPGVKERLRDQIKRNSENPEIMAKIGSKTRQRFEDPAEREKASERLKDIWGDPDTRGRLMSTIRESRKMFIENGGMLRKSNARLLTINGRTNTMKAWAQEAGVSPQRIFYRLEHGWDHESAVFKPSRDILRGISQIKENL